MRRPAALVALAVSLITPAVGVRAQNPPSRLLSLTFEQDGRVTLTATAVSMREILAEWARQCGCYVVNWDRIPGGPLPVPLQFERESQQRVLEAILRAAAGYVLTPKRAGAKSVSDYETIYIVPTSTAVATGYIPPPAMPTFMPMPTPGAPEDEIPSVTQSPPGGARPEPPGQPQPNRPGMPTAPPAGGTTGAAPRPFGTPSIFVPIVPVDSTAPRGPTNTPAPPQGTVSPGMPTAPPPMPAPNVPAPGR